MKKHHSLLIGVICIISLVAILACNLAPAGGVSSEGGLDRIRQWASSASASSEYESDSWSAMQATGERNTFKCGDFITAWAAASNDGVQWLELGYTTPVVPSLITIFESYNPGAIIKVEVRDLAGSLHTIWEGDPELKYTCPSIVNIHISNIDFKINSVLITLDQNAFLLWDEIDAVELVGVP